MKKICIIYLQTQDHTTCKPENAKYISEHVYFIQGMDFFTLSTQSPHCVPKRSSLSLASSPWPCLAVVAEAALDVPLYSYSCTGHSRMGTRPQGASSSGSILLIHTKIAL